MKTQVSKSQFKAKAVECFRQMAASGEAVVLTDYGQPKLEVRPYQAHTRQPLEILRGNRAAY